ncbi:MAG: hypothetical protein R3F11_03200 [Verrucomicrobiales bacterium]
MEVSILIGVGAEIGVGISLPFISFTADAVELDGAFKITWINENALSNFDWNGGKWKIAREGAFQVGLGAAAVGQYLEFEDLDMLVSSSQDSQNVTVGMEWKAVGGPDIEPAEFGEGLIGEIEGIGEVEFAFALEAAITRAAFRDDYMQTSTFVGGLVDLFVPFANDTLLQTVIGTALPWASLPFDFFTGRLDTHLGILTHAPVVTVKAGFTGTLGLSGVVKLGGKIPAVLGDASASLRFGLSVEAKFPIPIFEFTYTDPDILDDESPWLPDDPELIEVERYEPILNRSEISGVTILTHGIAYDDSADEFSNYFNIFSYLGDVDGDMMMPLALAMNADIGGYLLDYDLRGDGTAGGIDITQSIIPSAGYLSAAAESGIGVEVVLLYDWAGETDEFNAGWAESSGDGLFNLLIRLGLVDPEGDDNPALHFIGQGFGASVVSEAVERLAIYGVEVDHVTYLDPHDFDQLATEIDGSQDFARAGPQDLTGGGGEGYGAAVWDNVRFADVYFQNQNVFGLDVSGRAIPGAVNIDLSDETSFLDAHQDIWQQYYLETITDPGSTTGFAAYARAANRDADGDGTWDEANDLALLYASRPDPNFFAGGTPVDGRAIDAQSHAYSPEWLVNRSTGGLSAAMANAGYTAEMIENIRWSPRDGSFDLVNGDLSDPGDGATITPDFFDGGDEEIIPGWSHHGGGGGGEILADSGGYEIWLSHDTGARRTHNHFYIPSDAAAIGFTLRVDDAAPTGDVLQVIFGEDDIIGEVPIDSVMAETYFTSPSPRNCARFAAAQPLCDHQPLDRRALQPWRG